MTPKQIIGQFYIIYFLMAENRDKEAAVIFRNMKIVDSEQHLSLPKHTRHLIWDLHELLVLGDTKNATDRHRILEQFKELF